MKKLIILIAMLSICAVEAQADEKLKQLKDRAEQQIRKYVEANKAPFERKGYTTSSGRCVNEPHTYRFMRISAIAQHKLLDKHFPGAEFYLTHFKSSAPVSHNWWVIPFFLGADGQVLVYTHRPTEEEMPIGFIKKHSKLPRAKTVEEAEEIVRLSMLLSRIFYIKTYTHEGLIKKGAYRTFNLPKGWGKITGAVKGKQLVVSSEHTCNAELRNNKTCKGKYLILNQVSPSS